LNNYVDFHKNEHIKVSGDEFKAIYDRSLTFNKVSIDTSNAIEDNSYGNSND